MATINGTAGNDSLTGGAAADVLNGLDGADTLRGAAGADTLNGGNGNDLYIVADITDVIVDAGTANSGTDWIRTTALDYLGIYSLRWWSNVENLTWNGTAAAILKGNALSNRIEANSAQAVDDTLYGGKGDDSLFGYDGNDLMMGGAGDDLIDGGVGADTAIGGTGNDTYVLNSTGDRAFEYANGGFDTIRSAVVKDLRPGWSKYIEGLTYTGSTAAALHGNARSNLVVSLSATNDSLNGYDGNDTLDGGGGSNSLTGGIGNDVYQVSVADVVSEFAGEGTDTFVGAKTSLAAGTYATTIENLFYTVAAGATLAGNDLSNLMSGGAGNDTVNGAIGEDTLLGGAGSDALNGGAGNDLLYGGGLQGIEMGAPFVADSVADTLAGGVGDDRYLVDSPLDVVSETSNGGSFDVVISAIDNSLLQYPNVEALVLQAETDAWLARGTDGNDLLVGNESDNLLVGGLGNDTLSACVDVSNLLDPQSDVLQAGAGDDVLVVFAFGAGYSTTREASLLGGAGNDLYLLGADGESYGGMDSGGNDTAVMLSSGSIEMLEGVETVVLFGADPTTDAAARVVLAAVYAAANAGAVYDFQVGNAWDATGNAQANTIFGNDLSNHLVGGDGNDTLNGAGGDDTLEGGVGTDSLSGGAGNDEYYLDTGDTITEAADGGFDVINSLTITNFTGYANLEGLRYLGSTAVNLNRGSGNTSADLLVGGSGNDTVNGYGGEDTLGGSWGQDTVNGGAGNDTLFGDAGNDSLIGGTENDSVDGGDGADSIRGDLGDDSLYGAAGDDVLEGGGNWDRIDGGDGNDQATGGDGNDTLNGGAGDDVLQGDANNDRIVGDAGDDVIAGGSQSVQYTGSSQGDHLWGDAEYGAGGGADVFAFDTVTAENGVYESYNGSGQYNFVAGATIADFEHGLDRIAVAAGLVGDGDTVIENAVFKAGAGGTFSSTAEMVFVRANVADTFAYSDTSFFDPISAPAVSAALGNANAALAVGALRLFVVDDGSNSAVFLFQSNNGDANVTIDELYLVTVVTGTQGLVASDFILV